MLELSHTIVEIWSRSSVLEDIRRQNHAFSCSAPTTITLLLGSRKALAGSNIEKRLEQVLLSNSRFLISLGVSRSEDLDPFEKRKIGWLPKIPFEGCFWKFASLSDLESFSFAVLAKSLAGDFFSSCFSTLRKGFLQRFSLSINTVVSTSEECLNPKTIVL
jgi:hypothetical protein